MQPAVLSVALSRSARRSTRAASPQTWSCANAHNETRPSSSVRAVTVESKTLPTSRILRGQWIVWIHTEAYYVTLNGTDCWTDADHLALPYCWSCGTPACHIFNEFRRNLIFRIWLYMSLYYRRFVEAQWNPLPNAFNSKPWSLGVPSSDRLCISVWIGHLE